MKATEHSSSGQAVIELTIIMLIVPLFISGISCFSRIIIINQKLAMSVRYGAFLVSSGRTSKDTARNEVRNFLVNDKPCLAPSRITGPDFREAKSARNGIAAKFYSLDEVEISYKTYVPPLLRMFITRGAPYYTVSQRCVIQSARGAMPWKKGIY